MNCNGRKYIQHRWHDHLGICCNGAMIVWINAACDCNSWVTMNSNSSLIWIQEKRFQEFSTFLDRWKLLPVSSAMAEWEGGGRLKALFSVLRWSGPNFWTWNCSQIGFVTSQIFSVNFTDFTLIFFTEMTLSLTISSRLFFACGGMFDYFKS